jgi:hypothetical protein
MKSIKNKITGLKNQKSVKTNFDNFYSIIVILSILSTGFITFLTPIEHPVEAAPVIITTMSDGSWNDTFTDSTGLSVIEGVTINETRTELMLEYAGYHNNFDKESIGRIKNWTYEYSSNINAHNIINDPYYPGKCLYLGRNDNLATEASSTLWIEFNTSSYNIIEFDLTPHSMLGTNRQAYLYITYFDNGDTPIHEVRYYWDSERSGVPASNSTLTAIDLMWILPLGQPGDAGDVKFALFENITEEMDANPAVNTNSVLQNTNKTRFGFYQDAGPNWLQVDQVHIDNLSIRSSKNNGYVRSVNITPEHLHEWDTLKVIKTENGAVDYIRVSVIDAAMGLPVAGFTDMTGSMIDLSDLNANVYPSIQLQANFFGNIYTPFLHSWEISWTRNNLPIVDALFCSVNASKILYRTETGVVSVAGMDEETPHGDLIPTIQYRRPDNGTWQVEYFTTAVFEINQWNVDFTPPADAAIGLYDFRARFEDTMGGVGDWAYLFDGIDVKNNIPTAPVIEISPESPIAINNLVAYITNLSFDVEGEPITYTYSWYRNGEMDNSTILEFSTLLEHKIDNNITQRFDVWTCIVVPNDGNEFGIPGSDEVTILNSPPSCVNNYYTLEMFEDTPFTLENELSSIFSDLDKDTLLYSGAGNNNIEVTIHQSNGSLELVPAENWFGWETTTFSANDSFANSVNVTFNITVKPTNDLPEITFVGNKPTLENYPVLEFIVNEDDWLNLTVVVEDIDGDVGRGMITYLLNISERDNLYFNESGHELVFHPDNSDVGLHYINISITDNNDTSIQYITQHISIQVFNTNDPPKVKILKPLDGAEFLEIDSILFSCAGEDIDLLIPDSYEKLTYRWYVNKPESISLGKGMNITVLDLEPGEYNITVEVRDNSEASATDFIWITVKEVDQGEDDGFPSIFIWIVLIIIIAIISVILLLYLRKKKGDDEKEEETEDKGTPAQPTISMTPVQAIPKRIEGPVQVQPIPAGGHAQLPGPVTQGPAQPGFVVAGQPPVPPRIYTFNQPQVVVQEKVEIKEAEASDKPEDETKSSESET